MKDYEQDEKNEKKVKVTFRKFIKLLTKIKPLIK